MSLFTSLFMFHYSHKPGTVFNNPKNRIVCCPWAAHSPNVGSSWWNRIPYPFSVSYSPKHNLLSRTAQMGSKNFHTSVPRFGTDQTATHDLKPTQAFTKHLNKGKTSRIKPLPHGVCRNSNFLVSTTCTNFSPRIVELRLPGSREIFPFLFSPFLSFSLFFLFSHFLSFFLFFLYELFFFLFLPPFFSFLFAFLFFFSFLISFLLSFSFLLWSFSPIWMSIDRMGQKEEISSPPFLKPNVWLSHFHSFSFIS